VVGGVGRSCSERRACSESLTGEAKATATAASASSHSSRVFFVDGATAGTTHARARRTGPRTAACDARLIKRSVGPAGVAYICATVADIRQPAVRLSVGVVRKTGRLLAAAQTSDSRSARAYISRR